MKIIVALDNSKGMCFNKRRVSKDRVVTEKILELSNDSKLWISPFSAKLLEGQEVCVDEAFLKKAKSGEYCFVENQKLEAVKEQIEELIIFWWNRDYPSDLKLDLDLAEFKKVGEEEFPGHSHEMIKKEVFVK